MLHVPFFKNYVKIYPNTTSNRQALQVRTLEFGSWQPVAMMWLLTP